MDRPIKGRLQQILLGPFFVTLSHIDATSNSLTFTDTEWISESLAYI